ncbi:MAG: hypothetical protein A3F84_11365 [Candidatus Handelsmanbacteria bacterium RIFCSPLOWO2_12_FULL_64_10]|uniref:Peptidase M14 domain-containing protein n=1 Tax=Handelsmanbacteria sp. (strain RIFCSPLOWO2_12_FULL_64_10) TaxID=1817868 RepID=A0A1F6CDV5_HANXR|nr:MAG: hypothetical protein A3F84_11365 [Candidatus Handelsmanbacteria bacterium RIFCSPLOWO2_12_FULL_64_10]
MVWISRLVPVALAAALLSVLALMGGQSASGQGAQPLSTPAPISVSSEVLAQASPPAEAGGSASDADPAPAPRWQPAAGTESIIGFSSAGRPLTVYHLGNGLESVFIMGGQHGGPERNTTQLAWQLFDYFNANSGAIPPNLRLDFLPEANPDGLALGSRQFAGGIVDPNRNWGGDGWLPDTWDSNGVFRLGLGGPEPFSEPETQALRDYLLMTRPLLTINYHSRGGFLFRGGTGLSSRISEAYADASRYYLPGGGGGGAPAGGGGAGSVLGYRATGSMNVWLRSVGLGGFLIELATSTDSEYGRNLPAVQAALAILSSETASLA